jgi:hypothetical protein
MEIYLAASAANETIQHLSFQCPHVMFLWRSIYMVLGITPPQNSLGEKTNLGGKQPVSLYQYSCRRQIKHLGFSSRGYGKSNYNNS